MRKVDPARTHKACGNEGNKANTQTSASALLFINQQPAWATFAYMFHFIDVFASRHLAMVHSLNPIGGVY